MTMLPEAWRATPRKFPLRDRISYLRIARPAWAAEDEMMQFFEGHRHALVHGRLTLAATVQVNRILFEPGGSDAPGEVVYDLADGMPAEELTALATRLFGLRGESPADPRAARIGRYLENQLERVFGWPVPEGWGPETCRISTVYFPRKHLPGGYLAGRLLPVCVAAETGVAAVFPEKYLRA